MREGEDNKRYKWQSSPSMTGQICSGETAQLGLRLIHRKDRQRNTPAPTNVCALTLRSLDLKAQFLIPADCRITQNCCGGH